jgi:hypothetical protein
MSEPSFSEFLAALKAIPLEIRQHRIFPDITTADLPERGEALKGAVFSLLLTHAESRIPIDDLVEAVSVTSDLNPNAKTTLAARIRAILDIKTLDLIARAHSVLLEHESTYSSARIVSDIRAVFSDDVNQQPDAAVIVHMLNMIFYRSGERETFAVALDEKDIDHLISVLERAKIKTAMLRQTIQKGGLHYIGVT